MDDVDWISFYQNFTRHEGLDSVDSNNVDVLRNDMTKAWSHLAQSHGLEVAIRSLRDPQLLQVLLPNLSSWDDLVDRLEKRTCSEYITLGMVMKWFLVIQGVLCVLFLFPCLWPILSKYCICQIVKKGNNRYLYVNRSPDWGGQLPKLIDEQSPCDVTTKSEQYVTSYLILHVKSIGADWLPENIKSRVKKESKEIRASKELFEIFCRKLKKCEEEYQAALRRHQEATARRNRQNQSTAFSRFKDWCLGGVQRLFRSQSYEEVPQSEELSGARNKRRIPRKHLRRTYSAIPAQEYEKEELINMHLLPATPQVSSPDVKESTSLFNLR